MESVDSGTQTATINTEHTLATETDPGVYVLVIDTANVVAGDTVEFRIKTKAKSGGTSRLAYIATYSGVQTEPIKYSVPVPIDTEIVATLKQTATTGRGFAWNLLKL